MIIDHARCVRDERYLSKKRVKLQARSRRAGFAEIEIVHDDNGACCRRETWKATLARLVAPTVAASADRAAGDVAAAIAEHEPDVIIAGRPVQIP